ncbi:MAG: flagellar basal body P-ring formation chaperone FlgA [Pseudomonadota bacterium]
MAKLTHKGVIGVAVYLAVTLVSVSQGCGELQESRDDGSYTVPQQWIESVYKDHIHAHLPWPKEDLVVSRITTRQKVTLPTKDFSYEVLPITKKSYMGDTLLVVVFKVDGREVKREKISGNVDVLGDVVCASRPISRHETVTGKDVCLVRRSIVQAGPSAIHDFKEMDGYRLLTSVRAGEAIKKEMVEPTPVMRKGDRITILVESDGFHITATGEAMEAGGPGKVIRVRNASSKKDVYARIVDEATVRVEL